jgi:ABC-type bacteriocin/lantibiotic exporter with double-glycine peptidase domain
MLNRTIFQTLTYAVDTDRKTVESLWSTVKRYYPEKTLDSSVGRDGCNLSTGQKQIVRLLNAVLTEHARVLILDEPCSGLHSDLRDLVLNLIREAAYTHHKTVWLITHDEETASIGDSVKNL